MTKQLEQLQQAIEISSGNKRRAAIRKVFSEQVGGFFKECNWEAIGRKSPLIGEQTHQFNLRPSWSEYRDRCSPQVMAYIIHVVFNYSHSNNFSSIDDLVTGFIMAITEPEENSVIVNEICEGIHRYEFGRNKNWTGVEQVWDLYGGSQGKQRQTRKATSSKQNEGTKDMNQQSWTISNERKDRELLDSVLKQVTNNEVSVERIESAINGGLEAQKRAAELEVQLKQMPKQMSAPVVMPKGLPDLNDVKWVNANKIFRSGQKVVKALNFEVPVFDWDGVHRDVPEVDESYVFRIDILVPVLLSLVDNKKAWVKGHTGTGKSTLVKQIAARLGWPVITLSLDGEITRMDLIGRDSLTTENGQTVSKFVDGVLPRAFGQPCILLCDEIDFIRDDIAYALQTALNENEVTITEDGGRVVRATQWSRIIATANTLGQGDDSGLYRGAKVQSQAFLDRFTTWIDVPYMSHDEERKLIENAYPNLDNNVVASMLQYATEHRQGFMSSTVLQPLSPRGMLALADKYQRYMPLFSDNKQALKQSLNETLLNRSNDEDRIVLEGIVNRVFTI